jgi:hypothetical protein
VAGDKVFFPLNGKQGLSKRGGSSTRVGTGFAEKRLYMRRLLVDLKFSSSVFRSGFFG